jgi:hypothetical protein
VQWYEYVPAAVNVNLNVWPGLIVPEFHWLASAVEVWAVESLFVHATVVPTATVSGFVPKAVDVSPDAPPGMPAVTDGPVEVELGVVGVEGDDGDELDEEPQAAAKSIVMAMANERNDIGSPL